MIQIPSEPKRSHGTSAAERFHQDEESLEQEISIFMSNNSVVDFEDFKAKIKNRLPTGFSIIDSCDQLMFLSFEIVRHEGPKVAKRDDLSFELHCHNRYPSYSTNGIIEKVDDALNVLTVLNEHSSTTSFKKLSFEEVLRKLCEIFESKSEENKAAQFFGYDEDEETSKTVQTQQQTSQNQTEMDAIMLSAFLQEPNLEDISDFSSL